MKSDELIIGATPRVMFDERGPIGFEVAAAEASIRVLLESLACTPQAGSTPGQWIGGHGGQRSGAWLRPAVPVIATTVVQRLRPVEPNRRTHAD